MIYTKVSSSTYKAFLSIALPMVYLGSTCPRKCHLTILKNNKSTKSCT
ncbi:hypothetical protein [uncultured Gammaproteobacteria bacterium]|nr:hypothetical protein [uncultured Gammaproteobacteria bacterium]CAC9643089.1 hypothetical protein [uncultured Gammaproteobacteria bacterium]CAC9645429.1 hypothetical protein [uncultured Gammaproteobacteria bacterium]